MDSIDASAPALRNASSRGVVPRPSRFAESPTALMTTVLCMGVERDVPPRGGAYNMWCGRPACDYNAGNVQAPPHAACFTARAASLVHRASLDGDPLHAERIRRRPGDWCDPRQAAAADACEYAADYLHGHSTHDHNDRSRQSTLALVPFV